MSENRYAQRVKDVMSRDVVSIEMGTTVHEAIQLMAENRVSALPVVNRRCECVGILSTTDLIELAREMDEDLESHGDATEQSSWLVGKVLDGFGHQNVNSVMAKHLTTIRPEATLDGAAQLMLKEQVHRLPVVDDDRQLVGIISTMDLLEAFANVKPG
jgi:CBS domain-containing protein